MAFYQVELSDGRKFKVEADGQPSESDIYDFISQSPPAADTGSEPSYLSQLGTALGTGFDEMVAGTRVTANALTGDDLELAQQLRRLGELRQQTAANQTPADQRFSAALQTADQKWEQGAYLDSLTDIGGAIVEEPGAFVKTAVQSAPNAVVGLGGQLVGRGVGALIGGAVGSPSGPGAIATTLGGYAAGGVLANTLMESGPAIFDSLNERTGGRAAAMTDEEIRATLESDPTILSDGLTKGATRGAVIGLIESLGLYGAGRVASVPARTAAGRGLAVAGGAAVETGAAGAGEAGAQLATEGQITPSEVAMEMGGESVMSIPATLASKAFETAGVSPAAATPTSPQVDENIAPLTTEDIPRANPTVAVAADTVEVANEAEPIAPATADALRNIAVETAIESADIEATRELVESLTPSEETSSEVEIPQTPVQPVSAVETPEAATEVAADQTAEIATQVADSQQNGAMTTWESSPEFAQAEALAAAGDLEAAEAVEAQWRTANGQQLEEQTDEQPTISTSDGDTASSMPPPAARQSVPDGLSPVGQPQPESVRQGDTSVLAPGVRVTFRQEGQQREGVVTRLSPDGRSAYVQEVGEKRPSLVRVPNLTPVDVAPPKRSAKQGQPTVERQPFESFLRERNKDRPAKPWTDAVYAQAQAYADGQADAIAGLPVTMRKIINAALQEFTPEARAAQEAADAATRKAFSQRNRERPSDAPTMAAALEKLGIKEEDPPDDIVSASVGRGVPSWADTAFAAAVEGGDFTGAQELVDNVARTLGEPTVTELDARDDSGALIPLSARFDRQSRSREDTPPQSISDYQQVLRDELGLTNFDNIVFGNYRELPNGVRLRGFVRRASNKIFINLAALNGPEDLVDTYLEEAEHLVFESPEVAKEWARLKELVPADQLEALRREMEERGYRESVWDEEAFIDISRKLGYDWLKQPAWRRAWEAIRAAVRRIFGLTDDTEINRLSARLVAYAIENQQNSDGSADVEAESRGSPFEDDDVRMSVDRETPDERTFREAMANQQQSENIPGTQAARDSEKEKETTRARMQPPAADDAQYVAKQDADVFARAAQYLDSTPLDVALNAAQTGTGLPLGMEPATDEFMVVVGGLVERLAKAAEAQTDEFTRERLIAMEREAAKLFTQQGTQSARALRIRGQVNARLMPIAPILATHESLIERVGAVVDKRFEGGDPTPKVNATADKAGKEAGENVAESLGDEPLSEDEEVALTAAERQAQRLIYRVEERLRQGSKDLTTNKDGDSINRAFREQVTDPMEQQAFRDRLEKLNVGEAVADRLFLTASREAQDQKAMAVYRAARALRRKTESLIAKDSPSLAKLLNDLRRKIYPGMKWGDILTELPQQQRERQLAIYDRIRQHEALRDLTPDERLQLTNELDKAWQRERRKVFLRELNKVTLGAKADIDVQRVKAATPKLMRYLNLGLLNSEAFREAIASEYGLRTMTADESRELRGLAQEAWTQPEGIQRKRAVQKLLDRMQGITGMSRLEMFESYWVSSVLSGLRTQFDTWMSTLNGFATQARLSAVLAGRGKPGDAAVAFSEWFKGLGEGAREAMQILARGDYSYLKRFDADMKKSLEGRGMRPTPPAERMLREGNWWQKFPAAVMVAVSRSMSAADHMNNTATSRGARAVAKALNPDIWKGAIVPSAAEKEAAKQQAIREMTGGLEPRTSREKADVSARTREILQSFLPQEIVDEANQIGDIAAYQNDPTGLFGGIYDAINYAFGSMERAARKTAENTDADKFTRALAALAAVSLRSVLGVRFARFGMNFASNATSFVPGTYFARNPLYGAELSRSRQSLIFANNLIGAAGILALYSLFADRDDDDDTWGLEGPWYGLTPDQKRELMSAGKAPLTWWWRGKDGKVNRIAYRQWEIGSIFATVGSMLDKRKYQPAKWSKESVPAHLLTAVGSGMTTVKDLSALSALSDILGTSAYAQNPGEDIGKKINKVAANWVTATLPNAFRDVDAWTDPQHYKAETNLEAWVKGVPMLRRTVTGGRPMLTLLGDPVELDRSPWSRVYTNASQDPAYQAMGKLLARGIWVPIPSTERMVRKPDGTKARVSDLGQEREWQYQKLVGQKYKGYLLERGDQLAEMTDEYAKETLERDTARLRDIAAVELMRTTK